MLVKTPYSYCTRENADFTGLDYSASDFSVELAVDLPAGAFIGAIGEIMRHGPANATAGWTIHASSYGYSAISGWFLHATVVGSGQSAGIAYTGQIVTGRHHVVITFKRSTGVLKMYLDGVLAGTATNSLISMSATPGGSLTVGGANKRTGTYTPSVGGYAMPEFNMHFSRMFNGELTSTNVTDLYGRWNGTGRTDLPAGITPSIVSAWYMQEQVGTKAGAAGTGWLKDSVGSNHLQIVDTQAIVGGAQAYLTDTRSGAVSVTYPSNGATGVAGNVTLKANGLYGSNNYLQYYFEVDTANTFNTANLQNSGWTLVDGLYQPLLKPSTTYYVRVKAREGNNTGSESSWSSTISFTTRAATTYYVRPKTTAGTYGSENGTSYANAWNGFRHNGDSSGLQANLLAAQCDLRNLSPGDEVYACGNFGLMTGSTMSLPSTSPNREFVCGRGVSGYPVTVRMDHATYPGAIYHVYKYTGDYAWTSHGPGIYSTATYLSTSWIAVDDGFGVPSMGVSDGSMSLLTADASLTLASPGFYISGGRMYVRMPDDSNPGNNLWFLYGNTETYSLFVIGSSHVKLQGGCWFGTSPMNEITSDVSTFVHVKDALLKYGTGSTCVFISNNMDDWTFENCEFCWSRNGIYGWDTPYGASGYTGDRMTVTNCWLHDIGSGAWTDSDAHCVGWQNGSNWTIQDCLMQRSGSAITQWGYAGKQSQNNTIQRNIIIDTYNKAITFGAGISFENGGTTPGDRTGNQVTENIILNTEGPGIHYSAPDAVTIVGNMFVNNGTSSAVDSDLRNGISLVNVHASRAAKATITDNVVVSPDQKYVRVGGNGTLTDLTINENVYYTSGQSASTANKFQCPGYLSGAAKNFTDWKAGGTFDQASVWQNPTTATLPNGFDDMAVTFFLDGIVGDVNADGVADSDDLTALQADPGAPRLAMERYLATFMAEAPPTPAPGGGSAKAGRSVVWSLLTRRK